MREGNLKSSNNWFLTQSQVQKKRFEVVEDGCFSDK